MSDEYEYRIRPALPIYAAQIAELAEVAFADRSARRHPLDLAITEWQNRRSPVLVATSPSGEFLGYARCKPNEAGAQPRPDGQVAILAQVAVIGSARGRGIGTELMARALKTLRLLGYARVFAQIEPHLVGWYSDRGWTVHASGHSPVWIEPPIPSDAEWFPDLAPGAFAPLLSMLYLKLYPHLAEIRVGEGEPIAQAWFDNRGNAEQSALRSYRAMMAELDSHPELAARVPPGLRAMLEADRQSRR